MTATMPAVVRTAFHDRLRSALQLEPTERFLILGNFEVEHAWADGEIGLPAVGGASATASIVNHMDEFALMLGSGDDAVLLKSAPDAAYLDYLRSIGLDLAEVVIVPAADDTRTVTEDALADRGFLESLRGRLGATTRVLAHGMSANEARFCDASGLEPVHPSSEAVKRVNGKVYSRELCDAASIPQSPGWECRSVGDLLRIADEIRAKLGAGITVGVKDSYGVSGKGIAVLDGVRRFDQLVRMVERRAAKTGDDRLAVVVEEWAPKERDLNYHFTVGRDGEVAFDFVQEALTKQGVHMGHRLGAEIDADIVGELEETAQRVGARLASDGFWGPVGVDALTTTEGGLLPVLDINARNNMSTYQTRLQERFLDGDRQALARHFALTLTAPTGFDRVADALGPTAYSAAAARGLIVNNFATVNAAAAKARGESFQGRLYGFLVADDEQDLIALDAEIGSRLAQGGLA